MTKTVYVDHNILDNTLKGRINDLPDRLRLIEGRPVYSKESLVEIRRSRGREGEFLKYLNNIGALYLDMETDNQGKLTGKYDFYQYDSFKPFDSLCEALEESPETNFGSDKIINKMYGGSKNTSFGDILSESANDLVKMLGEIDLSSVEGVPPEMLEQIEELKKLDTSMFSEMGATFDENVGDSGISAFESHVGVGPKQLNNIHPPNVLQQVWSAISPSAPKNMRIDHMFGLSSLTNTQEEPRLVAEKVNAIYNVLNMLGYYRDKDMKKLRRVTASFSDMTHAGYASACHYLMSGDEDLVRKAEAAFEYLEHSTKVEYIDIKKLMKASGMHKL